MRGVSDLSRCLTTLDQDSTLIAVIELSLKGWLVAAVVPGLRRHPAKKLAPDLEAVLRLLQRWRSEAEKAGRPIKRITLAFEAGRDGFWLARWLRARGVEAYVIHPASVAVSREHRRAKTDRLDTEQLMRAFLGWLRGEKRHCQMVAIPSLAEEDARRCGRELDNLTKEQTRIVNRMKGTLAWLGIRDFNPALRQAAALAALRTPEGAPLPANTLAELERDLARLRFVREQMKAVETARGERLKQAPRERLNAMALMLTQVVSIGLDTADLLASEVFWRPQRDRRALARYGGLTGAPDESGSRRREKGLARAGSLRVRQAMIQLAWRFRQHQKESALARWYEARTANANGLTRKKMIVALARKLLIALWRYVTQGVVPEGVVLRPAS
jgi:transposase